MEVGRVNRVGQRALDKLRGFLRNGRFLRLPVEPAANVRIRSLGIQARVQRVRGGLVQVE